MKRIVFGSVLALALASCGGAPDNVGACKKYVAAVKCGTLTTVTDAFCDAYKNTTCDVSAYFTCLQEHYVCKDGMYDSAKLATIGDCTPKATCK